MFCVYIFTQHTVQYSIFLSPSYDSQLSICFHLSWKFRCSGNLSLFVSVIPDSSGSTTCPCHPLKKHYFLLIFRNLNFFFSDMVVAKLYSIFFVLLDKEQEKCQQIPKHYDWYNKMNCELMLPLWYPRSLANRK
jgi:hypothetical protein